MEISSRIERFRQEKRLSQKEMAEKLNVSPAYYGRLEKRDDLMSVKQLKEIANALGVDLESLITDRFHDAEKKEMWLNELSKVSINYILHDFLADILERFDHDLNEDSLIIAKEEDKEILIKLLLSKIQYVVIGAKLSGQLDSFLSSFFRDHDVAIYYRSKRDKEVFVDLNYRAGTRIGNRGFERKHPEL